MAARLASLPFSAARSFCLSGSVSAERRKASTPDSCPWPTNATRESYCVTYSASASRTACGASSSLAKRQLEKDATEPSGIASGVPARAACMSSAATTSEGMALREERRALPRLEAAAMSGATKASWSSMALQRASMP